MLTLPTALLLSSVKSAPTSHTFTIPKHLNAKAAMTILLDAITAPTLNQPKRRIAKNVTQKTTFIMIRVVEPISVANALSKVGANLATTTIKSSAQNALHSIVCNPLNRVSYVVSKSQAAIFVQLLEE